MKIESMIELIDISLILMSLWVFEGYLFNLKKRYRVCIEIQKF